MNRALSQLLRVIPKMTFLVSADYLHHLRINTPSNLGLGEVFLRIYEPITYFVVWA